MSILCPTCPLPLNARLVGGEIISECSSCGGSWYEGAELPSILQELEGKDTVNVSAVSPADAIQCPKCMVELVASEHALDANIRVMRCSACDGQWFEKGQLETMAKLMHREAIEDKIMQAFVDHNQPSLCEKFCALAKSRKIVSIFVGAYFVAFGLYLLTLPFTEGYSDEDVSLLGVAFTGTFFLIKVFIFPFMLIYFADELGNHTGTRFGIGPMITRTSPGIIPAVFGWCILLFYFVITVKWMF